MAWREGKSMEAEKESSMERNRASEREHAAAGQPKDTAAGRTVSVIVPVYNAQDYLERCVDRPIRTWKSFWWMMGPGMKARLCATALQPRTGGFVCFTRKTAA